MPFLPEAAVSRPPATSLTWVLTRLTPCAALAMSLESILIFGRRGIALPSPLLRPFLEAARAIPPAAPARAAPPATSGTFALPATLPTVLPAPPTALRTASTFDCLLPEPFEREAPLPLLGLRGLPLDFAFGIEAFGLAFEAFDLEAGFADFDGDLPLDFAFGFDFGVDLDFV